MAITNRFEPIIKYLFPSAFSVYSAYFFFPTRECQNAEHAEDAETETQR